MSATDRFCTVRFAHCLFSLERANKLLKVCADCKHSRLGRSIHAHWILTNQASGSRDAFQLNSLINLYAKCDQASIARRVFDLMPEKNVVSWSSLMTGYSRSGCSLKVLDLFKIMFKGGDLKPNEYIFAIVFRSCSDSGRVGEGRQFHGFVLKSGLLFHQYVRNALVYMYAKFSEVEEAMGVLNGVPGYDVLACNSVLSGLLENGSLQEGLEVLKRMASEDLTWDSITYVTVLGLCGGLKDLKLGLQVHSRMIISGAECDVFANCSIISMYGRCGKAAYAQKVFDRAQTRTVVLWTAIMSAYFQNGFFEEALKLFTKMELKGILPNDFTFGVLLNSTAELSILRHGDSLHAHVEKSGFKDYLNVGNALINMYSKCGSVESSNKVFYDMQCRDTITWNTMICGYSHHGMGKEALIVFQDMLASGESPNRVTFIGVLSACDHLGLVQDGFFYFNQLMNRFDVEPGLEHYTCIVGLLSKAGLLDEAEKFMKTAPVKWDVVAWRTLLNACHVRRNYDLGRCVAEHVIEMDPNDVGTYILLSNMYAKANSWDGVAKIRRLMRERQIKKEPGVSWIEIRNITRVFVSEDSNSPDSGLIYEKVRELLAKIKPLGYVPNLCAVFHDVEDEQKEAYLGYHSEKLAVAYGLMNTPHKVPLRIFKNLRMCDDCHSAMKLISKVSERTIIVRDANRFHHFCDGYCSCADYW